MPHHAQQLTSEHTDESAGLPREIWPWFLVGACVMLGAEWVAYGLRVRV